MKKLFLVLGFVLAASIAFSGCVVSVKKEVEKSPAVVKPSDAPSGGVSFDGRWTGSTEIQGFGTIPLGYDFISDGDKLTGTSDSQTGKVPIENGKIDGNNISFDVTIDFGGQGMVINYTGVLMGEKLKLNWPGQSGMEEVICTRE